MATKKKTTKKANGVPKNGARKRPARKLAANQNPHPRRLRGALFHEFKSASAMLAMRRQRLESINDRLNVHSMDQRYAPIFLLLKEREEVSIDIKQAIVDFAEVQKKVAKKFGIPFEELHKFTFDTSTGILQPSAVNVDSEET